LLRDIQGSLAFKSIMHIDSLTPIIIDLCLGDEGAPFEELFLSCAVKKEDLVAQLNDMLSGGVLEIIDTKQGLKYRSKKRLLSGHQLSEDEDTILLLIESTKSCGIWVRDLKQKSGLHQTVLNKTLKQLESRLLVRPVKALKFPTRKIYVSYSIQSLDESKYSSWYTDSEIDGELVAKVLFVVRKIFQSRSDMPLLATDIVASLKETKVLSMDITGDEMNQILDVLVLEEFITKSQSHPQTYRLRAVNPLFSGLAVA
jgi:DNA-directed RNA polymerase III subunit RPC6